MLSVGAASVYSESLAMTTLDKLYDRKDITLDEYIELAPDNVMPFKAQLKRMLQSRAQQQPPQQPPQGTDQNSLIQQLPPEDQQYLQQHPEVLQQNNA